MMPDMTDVLSEFGTSMEFAKVSKTVVDYVVTETKTEVEWFTVNAQPLPAQKLLVKPEGQRTWKWWEIWTTTHLKLDDILKDRCNRQYRVMEISDWSQAGYYHFQITEQPVEKA